MTKITWRLLVTMGIILIVSLIVFTIVSITNFVESKKYPMEYDLIVSGFCADQKVDDSLVYAMIKVTSDFDPTLESADGKKGLLQISDSAYNKAQELKKSFDTNLFDPSVNIERGVTVLSYYTKVYDDDKMIIGSFYADKADLAKWTANGITFDLEKVDPELNELAEEIINVKEKYNKIYKLDAKGKKYND